MILLQIFDPSVPGVNFYYVTTGLFGFALIFIIVGIFNYFRSVFEKMIAKMNQFELNQVLIKADVTQNRRDIDDSQERVKRLERLETEKFDHEKFGEMLIMKIRAITPPNGTNSPIKNVHR